MTISITVPTNPQSVGNTGHTTDHNTIVTALSTLGSHAANTSGDTFTGQVNFSTVAPANLPIAVTTTSSTTPTITAASAGLILCTASSAVTVTLPSPTSLTGLQFTFKNQTSTPSTVTINHNSTETIDGGTSYIIPASKGAYVTITTDGTNWYVIDNSAYQPVHADASANLASWTTETDITGATVSVVVPRYNSTVIMTGTFDMGIGNAKAATIQGIGNWNGSDETEEAVFTLPSADSVTTPTQVRVCLAQTWVITGVSPGTYTAKLRGISNINDSNVVIRQTHTGITVDVR